MQIREINIDGFGVFSHKRVTGLTSGLNVIYGENEAGKTTLIEFIRRMLFEVPKRAKGFNFYRPLNGEPHGGKLKCLSASGETFAIRRILSDQIGVTINTPNEELTGQSALNSLLGHATWNIFQNIFAFTLDELQTFDSLKGDEIKNHIYGAELGLGVGSLKKMEYSINKRADEIFLPKGRKTETTILLNEIKTLEEDIRDIQNEAQGYDQLTTQLESLESQKIARHTQIASLDSLIKHLETRKGLCKLQDEEETQLKNLNTETESLTVNHELLTHEDGVVFLQQSMQSIRTGIDDRAAVQRERTDLENQIQEGLHKIGASWNENMVKNFDFDRSKNDEIRSFFETFADLRREVTLAEDRLENHMGKTNEEKIKGLNASPWLKIIAWTLAAPGLAGAIWSLVEKNFALLAAALISITIGFTIFWKTFKERKSFDRKDLQEKTLEIKLDQAQLAYDQKNLEWRAFLKKISLDEKLDPLGAQETRNRIKEIEEKISRKKEFETRIREMLKVEEDITRRIEKIKPSLPENSLHDYIPANMKIICELYDQAKANQQTKVQIKKQIEQQNSKIEKHKSQLQETDQSREQILLKARAVGGIKVPSNHQIVENENFLRDELDQLSDQLKELEEEKNGLYKSSGETENKLKQLTSGEELLKKQETLETKKQHLRESALEWSKAKICLFMLKIAKSQYEKNRQPEVLKAARKVFSVITDGKYPQIIKPIDNDEFRIETEGGDRKRVIEMSRGTREQLYLSMRLGLIEEYETRSEPLPIIMDDVLVNFDDPRKSRVIETLKDFAESRQIIVLTCHRSSLHDYLAMGATQIQI